MVGITDDCESCQNAISALTTHVSGVDFALGPGGMAHANHPHLHLFFSCKKWVGRIRGELALSEGEVGGVF